MPVPSLISAKVPAPSEMTPETMALPLLPEAPSCKACAPATLEVTLPAAFNGAEIRIGIDGPPP